MCFSSDKAENLSQSVCPQTTCSQLTSHELVLFVNTKMFEVFFGWQSDQLPDRLRLDYEVEINQLQNSLIMRAIILQDTINRCKRHPACGYFITVWKYNF